MVIILWEHFKNSYLGTMFYLLEKHLGSLKITQAARTRMIKALTEQCHHSSPSFWEHMKSLTENRGVDAMLSLRKTDHGVQATSCLLKVMFILSLSTQLRKTCYEEVSSQCPTQSKGDTTD